MDEKLIEVNGIVGLMTAVHEQTLAGNKVLEYSLQGLSVARGVLTATCEIGGVEADIRGPVGAMLLAEDAALNNQELTFPKTEEQIAICGMHYLDSAMTFAVMLAEPSTDAPESDSEETSDETDIDVPEDTTEGVTEAPESIFDLDHARTLTKVELVKYCFANGAELTGKEKALGKGKLVELLESRYESK